MTPFDAAANNDPQMYAYLVSNGWTADRYNALKPYERTALRVEMNGGLDEVSFAKEFGKAVVDTSKNYAGTVATVATKTSRNIKFIAAAGAVIAVAGAAVIYRRPIQALLKGGGDVGRDGDYFLVIT